MVWRQNFKVLVGLISVVLVFGTVAQATVLDFNGSICGGACSNGLTIDQTYGDIAGQLDVAYAHRVASGNSASDEAFLKWWDTGYSNLTNVAWGGIDGSGVSEIKLIPAAGFKVTLNSFDLGAFGGDRGSQETVYDASYASLQSSGATTINGVTASTFAIGLTNASGLIIQWGPESTNVGIDNINFTVEAIPSNGVPEPSTLLLIATGFGILGYGWRRRRA